jgi:hypothetical protein
MEDLSKLVIYIYPDDYDTKKDDDLSCDSEYDEEATTYVPISPNRRKKSNHHKKYKNSMIISFVFMIAILLIGRTIYCGIYSENDELMEDKTNGFCPRNLLRRTGNITDYISSDIDLYDKVATSNDVSISTINDETKTKELLVEKMMNKKSWFQPPQSLLSSKRIFIHK